MATCFKFSSSLLIALLFSGYSIIAYRIEITEDNFTPNIAKQRSIRDIGAATWPIYNVGSLEAIVRLPRSSEKEIAVILIEDFWRNFGKRADEVQQRIDTEKDEQENTEVQGKASNADGELDDDDENLPVIFDEKADEVKAEEASFRYSTHDDLLSGIDNQGNQNVVYTPSLVVPPQQPPYFQPQYSHGPLNYPYTGVYYSQATQTYPNGMVQHDQYGLPVSTISPFLLQKLIMNDHSLSQESVNYSPSVPYGRSTTASGNTIYSSPSRPSFPRPTYSFTSTKPSEMPINMVPYQQAVAYPNTAVNSGPLPTYPYSS